MHVVFEPDEVAKAAEQALEKALREQETAALELNKQAIRYNVLARDVESDRALYQSVLSRIKETSLTRDLKPDRVRIVQRAQVPEAPVRWARLALCHAARQVLRNGLSLLGVSQPEKM